MFKRYSLQSFQK